MLTRTRFGRNIDAVGGNRDAAALVRIRVWRVEFIVFGPAGMFAAFTGIPTRAAWMPLSLLSAKAVIVMPRPQSGTDVGTLIGAATGAYVSSILSDGMT